MPKGGHLQQPHGVLGTSWNLQNLALPMALGDVAVLSQNPDGERSELHFVSRSLAQAVSPPQEGPPSPKSLAPKSSQNIKRSVGLLV